MQKTTDHVRLAHLVNPVSDPLESSLLQTQRLTFESMRRAASEVRDVGVVDLLTARFSDAELDAPADFLETPALDRSVVDMHAFTHPHRLPFLADLIERLYAGSTADYLIYTNVDIILHPSFYRVVLERIRHGYDAFIINRRRIAGHYRDIAQLPEIYSLVGAPHPGFDCFVFRRDLYPKFQLGHVCVGIPFVGMLLAQNLFCHADRFRLFDRDILTYHIGMEIFKHRDPEYVAFNKREFWEAMRRLDAYLDSSKFPWGERNIAYRLVRWGVHPSIPIRLALRLEPRRWRKRFRFNGIHA